MLRQMHSRDGRSAAPPSEGEAMIYIRTDMNETIATGHVMRCLSIADAAGDFGEACTFLLADAQAKELVEARGHHAVILGTKWEDMESELPVLNDFIRERGVRRLLIDSYQATARYLSSLSGHLETVYMDDIHAFHYPVHALICYANYWRKFAYPAHYRSTKLYLGPEYVPLKGVFASCGEKAIEDIPRRLLLLSGGADPYHALERMLEKLAPGRWDRIDVICGRYCADYERMKRVYIRNEAIVFHQAVADIETYMRAADVAVSAGGSTLYELCAAGTPAISYSFADNQLNNVRQFAEDGLIEYAGDIRYQDIAEAVSEIMEHGYADKEKRRRRSAAMQRLVDGRGAWRIAEILTGKAGGAYAGIGTV